MLWQKIARWVVPAVVFVGTSALTVAIFALPGLSLGVLATLVGARLLLGFGRLLVMFQLASAWVHWRSTPQLAGAV